MYAQSHQVRSKSPGTFKVIRYAQSHQVRSMSSGTLKVIRYVQGHQVRSVIRFAQSHQERSNSSGSLKVITYAQNHQVCSKSSCSLKVKISDSFGSKKRLNRIIKLGLGHLCPMEENLSFINNYIIYDLAGWYHDLGLIKGMIWKMTCYNLYIYIDQYYSVAYNSGYM